MSFRKIVALVVVTACFGGVAAAPAVTLQTLPTVELIPAQTTLYEKRIQASGTIESRSSKEIYLETPVLAQSVHVAVGDYVHEGELLATIDAEMTRKVLEKSQPASSLIGQGLAAGISLEDTAQLAGLYTALEAAGLGGGLDQALETLAQDQAPAAANAYVYIPDEIVAPMDGVVTRVELESDVLSRTANPLICISDTGSFAVMASVNESNIGQVHIGDVALITGTGFEGKTYAGHVSRIYPTARRTSASAGAETVVDVEIAIDEPDEYLKAGFTARVELVTDQQRNLLAVPYEAVGQDTDNQEYVYVARDGQLERRFIETGLELADGVEVVSGLAPEELVAADATATDARAAHPVRLHRRDSHAD